MGYSRAVVKGGWCFVSGVTGYDYATMTMPDSITDQGRNCFATIAGVLAQGGFEMADIVREQTAEAAAELEALRATRLTEIAEMDEILAALEPHLTEAGNA